MTVLGELKMNPSDAFAQNVENLADSILQYVKSDRPIDSQFHVKLQTMKNTLEDMAEENYDTRTIKVRKQLNILSYP